MGECLFFLFILVVTRNQYFAETSSYFQNYFVLRQYFSKLCLCNFPRKFSFSHFFQLCAGEALLASGFRPTIAITSLLTRAQATLELVQQKADLTNIPVIRDWRLNERHYGVLTGLNKADCVQRWGSEQVAIWRRSYSTPPGPMDDNHPFYQEICQQKWVSSLPPGAMPRAESLEDLVGRTGPYWTKCVEPKILEGHTVLCVAHGTSLRGVVKQLEGISDNDICKLDLPNGIPIVYRLNSDLQVIGERQYLADEETVRVAVEKVSKIGPKKTEIA